MNIELFKLKGSIVLPVFHDQSEYIHADVGDYIFIIDEIVYFRDWARTDKNCVRLLCNRKFIIMNSDLFFCEDGDLTKEDMKVK